jgi:hypothetical protein
VIIVCGRSFESIGNLGPGFHSTRISPQHSPDAEKMPASHTLRVRLCTFLHVKAKLQLNCHNTTLACLLNSVQRSIMISAAEAIPWDTFTDPSTETQFTTRLNNREPQPENLEMKTVNNK